jgi:chorismate synthase
VGLGFTAAGLRGSQVQDEIFYEAGRGFYRLHNRAGGIEGGVTNGETLVVRGAMKPIPTLNQPLQSVDMITRKPSRAAVERSDVCAVPAACVIGEALVAWELARACLEKCGGDSLEELKDNWNRHLSYLRKV